MMDLKHFLKDICSCNRIDEGKGYLKREIHFKARGPRRVLTSQFEIYI